MTWFNNNRLSTSEFLLVNKCMGIGPQKQNRKQQNQNVTD